MDSVLLGFSQILHNWSFSDRLLQRGQNVTSVATSSNTCARRLGASPLYFRRKKAQNKIGLPGYGLSPVLLVKNVKIRKLFSQIKERI